MEIEGFREIAVTIALAKELHDMGRYDIVEKHFFDTLCYDSWFENMWGTITSVFSGIETSYDEDDETEMITFTDDVITNYFIHAWDFGKKTDTPHDKNPYVIEAEEAAGRWLNFTYSLAWDLLGYTKSIREARKSKLIVYTCASEFCEHDYLAYGLIQLYKWFSEKCAEFAKQLDDTNREELMAA